MASDVEIDKATHQLKQIKQDIQQLRTVIDQESRKKNALITTLNQHQQRLDALYRQIANLSSRYQQHAAQHVKLKTRYQDQNKKLQLSHDELTSLIKAMYWLSYRPDDEITQAYCYYFYQSQQDQLTQLRSQLEILYQHLGQAEKRKKITQTNLSQQKQHHLQLQHKIQRYNEQLNQSHARLSARQTRLEQLTQNKAALDKLIEELTQSKLKTTAISRLYDKKGQLPWPIQGRLVRCYGELIERSELRSTGVFIKAKPNQVVKSVAAGKVVFADQLRGLGALIVVEHGPGDLSLYGHNARLLKKKGDQIQPKENLAIAAAHTAHNTIYFELRLAGKAVDPKLWCFKH